MKKATMNSKTKLQVGMILSSAFTAVFLILFFTPLDTYLHNPTEFVVGWKFLLPNLFFPAFVGFLALAAILFLLRKQKILWGVVSFSLCGLTIIIIRFVSFLLVNVYYYFLILIVLAIIFWVVVIKLFKEKAIDIALLLLWGIILAAYIQVLFLNSAMVTVTGDRANYNLYSTFNLVNFGIWLIIALLPLGLWSFLHKKEKGFNYEKVLIFTTLLICCMQTAGLVSTAMVVELSEGFEENPMCLSYEQALEFGSEENIIVIILDRLDVEYMKEMLETYPALYQQLDGFTFYQDNIGEFRSTFPTITTMLTGHYFEEGMTFSEYWKEAWSQRTMLDRLKDDGYTNNLLIDKLSTYGSFHDIEKRTDNLVPAKIKADPKGVVYFIGRLSLSRLSPYLFKNSFLNNLDPAFGNKLFKLSSQSNVQQLALGIETDLAFYKFITSTEATIGDSKKMFKFIHLNCAHTDRDESVNSRGIHYDEQEGNLKKGGTYLDSIRACFEIVKIYTDKMKELGVYDNSTLIFMADHAGHFDGTFASTASLLIKRKDERGSLKIDSTSQLSNKYLATSILELADLRNEEDGFSFFDIVAGETPPNRYFYFYSTWRHDKEQSNTIKLTAKYEIIGDANDFSNWKVIGNK